MNVKIIGAGLAGSEAAWQLAEAGVNVELFEMRPLRMTKAHKSGLAAELVCSNSFRGADLSNAVGLLKQELLLANTLFMRAALASQVPAGGAFAVDRELFSAFVDHELTRHPGITRLNAELEHVPEPTADCPVIVATGPLTSPSLAKAISALTGSDSLAFFDAISPIILAESIDMTQLFRQSRYDKGAGDDYLNIPLSEEAYRAFIDGVAAAEKFGGHEEVESDQVDNLRPFEGCMPIEEMIARGPDTLRFGPMKPKGLTDPKTGRRPHAVIQLRQDNREATLWSMVGFQTKMKHGEQLKVFRALPGLENAEFVRLGSLHRNTFLDSPKCLTPALEFRNRPGLFFAGQITGVEGYVESTAAGFIAAYNALRFLRGEERVAFPIETAMGALTAYISDPERKDFQPMNISFGLMPTYAEADSQKKQTKDSKKDRRRGVSLRALEVLAEFLGRTDFNVQDLTIVPDVRSTAPEAAALAESPAGV